MPSSDAASSGSHVSLSMTASVKPNIIGLSEVGSAKRLSRLGSIPEGSSSPSAGSEAGSKLKSLSSVGKSLGKRASAVAKEGADASRAAMWQEVLHAATPPHSSLTLRGGEDVPAPAAAGNNGNNGNNNGTTGTPPTTAQTALKNAKAVCDKMAQSRILVSLLVFLTTIILLLAINPPMAQTTPSEGESPRRSWKKITVWSTIAMLLALILPYTSKSACLGSAPG